MEANKEEDRVQWLEYNVDYLEVKMVFALYQL